MTSLESKAELVPGLEGTKAPRDSVLNEVGLSLLGRMHPANPIFVLLMPRANDPGKCLI